MKPRILILSAYDAQSHRYWHQGMMANLTEYDFTLLSLPPRHFSWRIRGNSLYWAHEHKHILNQEFDLLVATSMVDLSALKGFVPKLSNIPSIVYFHENQFAYPSSGNEFASIEPKILNIYSAVSANQVLFNSEYNRATFLAGAEKLLNKMPDHKPEHLSELLAEKSHVLPVPITLPDKKEPAIEASASDTPLHILWNHRWEYDKGPKLLLEALDALVHQSQINPDIDFQVSLVGQQFRKQPAEFGNIQTILGNKLKHFGFVENKDSYHQILREADVCLSTALHDFQGIAMLEASAYGCVPILPNRLAYPELFPKDCLYTGNGNKTEFTEDKSELEALVKHLIRFVRLKRNGSLPSAPDVSGLSWKSLSERYSKLFSKMMQQD